MNEEVYFSIVRLRIRKFRNELGLTQNEVAQRVGIELRHYQRYETHKRTTSSMSLSTLRKISQVFEINIENLLREPSEAELQSLKHAL